MPPISPEQEKQPILLSLRSSLILHELPGLGLTDPGRTLLTDRLTGHTFALTAEQSAVVRTLQLMHDTVTFQELGEAVNAKFGITVDPAAVHDLLKDLAALALDTSHDASPDHILVQQLQRRNAVFTHLQHLHLSALLKWMTTCLEFYKQKLAGYNIRIQSRQDITALPFTTREDVRQNLPAFLPATFNQYCNMNWRSTSGTTNERMQTVHVGDYLQAVTLRVLHLNPLFDVPTIRSPMCVLTTPVCSGLECHMEMNAPFEKRLRYGGALFLNSVMSPTAFPEDKLEHIIAEMRTHKPRYLYCNAAYTAALASYVLDKQISLPPLKAVVASFEVTSRIHKRLLAKAFAAPVLEVYGCTEVSQAAVECEDGQMHVPHDSHILEILNKDLTPVSPGELGRVYITSLRKYTVPLLRYQTTDLARASLESSQYRSEFAFQRVEGRMTDLITTPDGHILTPRLVDDMVSKCETGVGWYSLVQKNRNTYRLYLVPSPEYTTHTEQQLAQLVSCLLGHEAQIAIEPVKELRPGSSGKFRLCYQEHPQPHLQNAF